MTNQTPNTSQGFAKKFLFFLKFLEIRLRFVLILVITALVVGYWDNIQNHIERWQRNHGTVSVAGAKNDAKSAPVSTASEDEYFCAMHPFVVRDHPDKCPICGMELTKRKKGEAEALPAGTLARVQVSPDRIMQAGVEVEPVALHLLVRTVRTYGNVEPDETRLAKISARFAGRIDKLMVNAVGMAVVKGQPLAQIYSPKFLAATQEYVQALKAQRAADAQNNGVEKQRTAQLVAAARQRLLLAGFTESQLDSIAPNEAAGGSSAGNESVTLNSPLTGIVLEKNALQGETVEEGTVMYTIADLSHVWVQALAIESDLAAVKAGMPVEVAATSYPGEIFYGTVDFIYPTINVENRSIKVRVAVDNQSGKLKPGMYVSAVMRSPLGRTEDLPDSQTQMQTTQVQTTQTMSKESARPELPTLSEEDAARFMDSLAPGAKYFECGMHPEVRSDAPGECPKCRMELLPRQKPASGEFVARVGTEARAGAGSDDLMTAGTPMGTMPLLRAAAKGSMEQWAVGYSCPMHPDELNDSPGICTICGCGMKLVKMRAERVLAIPETAVIDTGMRFVVYVESMPGVYDSRAVTLGPRAGEYYPVLAGIAPGERIVTRGSFLIDAEARLNPANVATSTSATMKMESGSR